MQVVTMLLGIRAYWLSCWMPSRPSFCRAALQAAFGSRGSSISSPGCRGDSLRSGSAIRVNARLPLASTGRYRSSFFSLSGPRDGIWIFTHLLLPGQSFSDTLQHTGYLSDLYVSGTNFFTLGLGDVTPHTK